MEDNLKLNDYVDILEIFINHRNDLSPITPKQLKSDFGMDSLKPKSNPYEQKKRSLDRCLDFYSSIRLISILTNTTLNEISRLERMRKDRYTTFDDRKQLDPYIKFTKEKRKKDTTKIKCDLYNVVVRYKKDVEVVIDSDGIEYEMDKISNLPKPFENYDVDNDGYRQITKSFKVKIVKKNKTVYEFIGDKFKNITTPMNINFTDDNGVQRNISDEITIDTKTFEVVDIYENSVRALDCMYRLTTECDYYENDLPITFKLPSEDKFDLFVKFLIQNVKKVGDTFTNDLTDELITSVVNSNAFGEYKGLVLQTIGNLHLYKKDLQNDKSYTLDYLIGLVECGSDINIQFENFGNNFNLQNTKLEKITVNTESFDLHFDNFISKNQTNISQIKKIEKSIDNLELNSNVRKVMELIDGLDDKHKEFIKDEFQKLSALYNVSGF